MSQPRWLAYFWYRVTFQTFHFFTLPGYELIDAHPRASSSSAKESESLESAKKCGTKAKSLRFAITWQQMSVDSQNQQALWKISPLSICAYSNINTKCKHRDQISLYKSLTAPPPSGETKGKVAGSKTKKNKKNTEFNYSKGNESRQSAALGHPQEKQRGSAEEKVGALASISRELSLSNFHSFSLSLSHSFVRPPSLLLVFLDVGPLGFSSGPIIHPSAGRY